MKQSTKQSTIRIRGYHVFDAIVEFNEFSFEDLQRKEVGVEEFYSLPDGGSKSASPRPHLRQTLKILEKSENEIRVLVKSQTRDLFNYQDINFYTYKEEIFLVRKDGTFLKQND